MSTSYKITPVTPIVQHAEGPHWEPKAEVLYYVDTFKATAYRFNPKTKGVTSIKLAERNSIGTIMPIKNKKDQFIVSADRYIYHLAWNGLKNNTGKVTELLKIEAKKPKNQFNDGKADVKGNMWIGTLTRDQDLGVSKKGGSLYKFVPNNKKFSCEQMISNVGISNGIAWSRDNKNMFFIDSSEKTVEKYTFDADRGSICNRTVLFDLKKHPEFNSICDGMTIDADDNLYVALFGGSAVLKIDSVCGKIKEIIKMPAKYITSATFGGPNLDILYVTSSRLHEPNVNTKAGAVFEVTGLGEKGLPLYEPAMEIC